MTYHFVPFASNSVTGGYLLWAEAKFPVLALWNAEHRFWAINYPIYGINLSCYETQQKEWRLSAQTSEIGMAPPLPLLVFTYSSENGLVEDYRYSYPDGMFAEEELARFNDELDEVTHCFRAVVNLLLKPENLTLGSALEPRVASKVEAHGQWGEEQSWHLRKNEEELYLVHKIETDDAAQIASAEVYKNQIDLPLALLTFNLAQKTCKVTAGLGYSVASDEEPCLHLAQAILEALEC